jgi:hypothetical protein
VNDFDLCVESSTRAMLKREHSYFLMHGIPKDDHWRFFHQLMYHKIDTMSDEPEEGSVKMNAQKAQILKDNNSEVAAMFSKSQTKNEMCNSKQTRKTRKSHHSNSQCNGSCSESEKHRFRNWRNSHECYRCQQVGHTARYCPCTAPAESTAPTESAAATTMTSIEYYWMTGTNRESPSNCCDEPVEMID